MLFCPLVLSGQTARTSPAEKPVAVVAGQPIFEQDLVQSLGPELMKMRQQEYEAENKALESLIRHRVVEIEAKRRNISAEKLIEQEVDSKVSEPTDAEVEAYSLAQNPEGPLTAESRQQYRRALKQLKLVKARQAYADSLRARTDVAVLLRPPSVDVPYDASRVKGDPRADVTIVEFADYQCPYCQRSESAVKEILSKYQGRVKLAFLDFPLTEIHPKAEKAAEAARCAGVQGKFWQYHDSLFADQSKLDESSLVSRARDLKLDEGAFRSCLASGKFKPDVEADRREGDKVGVAGTPAYFINGIFLSGAQPQAEFERVIDRELSFDKNRARLQ